MNGATTITGSGEPLVLLRLPEVIRRCGKSRATIYREIKRGLFPAPVKLGENSSAWAEHEISAWIRERLGERKVG